MLKGKHIILGITGSIAAYKAAYIIRDCRSDENGCFARQVSCHQHVIGYSISHLADCRRCCRSNQHGICPQSQIANFSRMKLKSLSDEYLFE